MNWMFLPLRRYADFNGRSRRMEYWMWALLNLLVGLLLAIPLVMAVWHAVNRVNERGGVTIRSGYDSPYRTDPGSGFGSDNGARGSGQDTYRDDERGTTTSENGAKPYANDGNYDAPGDEDRDGTGDTTRDQGSNGDKVSSRGPAVDGGILAYGYSSSYQVDVNPFMFMQEFGPVGWVLFGLYCLWGLITFIPSLAVAIRRLHDTDRSGFWLFIGLVPLVGAIVLLVFFFIEGTRGPNRFGPDPKGPRTDGTFA